MGIYTIINQLSIQQLLLLQEQTPVVILQHPLPGFDLMIMMIKDAKADSKKLTVLKYYNIFH